MTHAPVATQPAVVIDLSGPGWTLRCLDGDDAPVDLPADISATVPGCVHTDLLAADLIPNPYLDRNEDDQHWIGRARWVYRTSVDLPVVERDGNEPRRFELVCAGLDTVAAVHLNGIEVGATANMHRRYRFDLAAAARVGTNVLEIELSSPLTYAEALETEGGRLPAAYPAPFNYIRKMACNFGWDWGPTLVTAGIWRGISIEIGPRARLGDLRIRATWTGVGPDGTAHLRVRPEHAAGHDVRVVVSGPGVDGLELTGAGGVEADLPGARPWWPHSMGDQPLYRVTAELLCGHKVVDRAEAETGFRTVTLDTSADPVGRRFVLAVNGVELFVRGANWIPDDCFLPRVDAARYAERVGQATAAGIDLLRVWGGGIYEDDAFYAACDAAGVLVWQDFLFACAAYPEEDPIRSEVIAEATDNVSRLMPHPSLALWNGNNENLWGHEDWNWTEQLGGRSWGASYYFDVLPTIVAIVDGSRPYWPGSPWSGDAAVHPNAMTHGCSHIWDVWNVEDFSVYADHDPRFASEFGFQGPPTWATLTQAIRDDPLAPDSPAMLAHQKAEDGLGKLNRGLSGHLPTPSDFTDWHFATQLNQARAVAYGIRHHRSLRGHCMGSIVWQLNDCWPVSSWAALDSGNRADGPHVARRKPLWYALREAFADHLIIADQGNGIVLVNDGGEAWSGTLALTHYPLDGVDSLPPQEMAFQLAPRSSTTVPEWILGGGAMVWEVTASTGERAVVFGAEDVDLGLPVAAYEGRVETSTRGVSTSSAGRVSTSSTDVAVTVTVTATSVLRSLCLFADRVHPDAETDTMMIDLLPGQSHTFNVLGPAGFADGVDQDTWLSAPVLRCANQLINPTTTPIRRKP